MISQQKIINIAKEPINEKYLKWLIFGIFA